MTRVAKLSLSDGLDLLVAAGDFNGILIYSDGAIKERIETVDWTSSLSVRDGKILVGTTDEILLYNVGVQSDAMDEN